MSKKKKSEEEKRPEKREAPMMFYLTKKFCGQLIHRSRASEKNLIVE